MVPASLSEKAAQLLFPRIGSNMRPSVSVEDDALRVEHLLAECSVGGLVLFNGDASRTPDTLAHLQSLSAFPILVATDMERGLGQQLKGATIFPHAFAFDVLGEEAEAAVEECAHISAQEALACGIHISFSPVADVHSNPDNPIISIRCYGSDSETVSGRVHAYLRGCKKAGLLSTAKHFPGHGDTSTDSHEQIPVVLKRADALDRQELVPFACAIENDVDLVMTAHVAYPGLDPSGTVATASYPILTKLLRDKMGFGGAVITDSLLMEGARRSGQDEIGEDDFWAARLLLVGVDILLDIPDPKQTVVDLLRAVDEGLLPAARIEEASARVWALKERIAGRFGWNVFQNPSNAAAASIVGCKNHKDTAQGVAERATIIVSGSPQAVSLDRKHVDEDGLLVLLVRPHVTYNDPTAGSLATHVSGSFENATFHEIIPDMPSDVLDRMVDRAPEFGAVVVAAVVKPAAWHRFGLLPEQKDFIARLVERCPIILAALGSPRVLDDFPDAALGICTFSDVDVSQQALVSMLASLANA